MKRKIAALFVAAVCIPMSVYAVNTAEVTNRNGVISVEGKTSPDTTVTLTVKSADDESGLYAVKETFSDPEGNYSFDFILRKRQTEQDIYEYILSIKGDGEYSEKVTVFSSVAVENYVRDIKSGKLQELLDEPVKEELAKSLGLDIDGYKEVKDSSDVTGSFYNDIDIENATNDEIVNVFNTEIILIRSVSAEENEFFSLLGKDFEEREISGFTQKRLYETKNYKNIKEYEEQILMFETLDEINNARYSQLEEIFEENEKILTLDKSSKYSEYKDMSSAKKRKVNESIVSALLKNPVQSTADFIKVFERKVNDVKDSSSGNGGGGNSGGGGSASGSKGTSSSVASVVVRDTSENIMPEKEKLFTDVEADFWAEDNIRTLAEKKIINGYEDGTFRPQNKITREEFITILVNAFKLENTEAECNFADVGKDKWFYKYVASAYEAGVVNGISETEFGTSQNITRQDVAVMLARVTNATDGTQFGIFADDRDIADYAKTSVYALKKMGIINGKDNNLFDPRGECTRAECATMVKKALDI